MTISALLADELLDLVLGDGHNTTDMTATVKIGLSSTAPAADGTNVTEPNKNGYAQVVVANTTANFSNAAAGSKTNAAAITFPTVTSATDGTGWGTVGYWFLTDANGVFKLAGALSSSVSITTGSTPSFAASSLTITLS
jgi:hypothetical protein